MSSSFRRGGRIRSRPTSSSDTFPKTPLSSSAVLERVGTKPWVGGFTLTSSGLREFDAILGGGQPLGTAMLLEEDRWTQDLAMALMRYWAGEAVAQGQTLSLAATQQDVKDISLDSIEAKGTLSSQGMSSIALSKFLQMIPLDQHFEKAKSKDEAFQRKIDKAKIEKNITSLSGFDTIQEDDDYAEEEMEDTVAEEGLTNAWQYKLSIQNKRMGPTVSNQVKGQKVFCHSFDLGSSMMEQNHPHWPKDMESEYISILENFCGNEERATAIAFFHNCVKHIEEKLNARPNTVIRMLIMNAPISIMTIAMPLLLSHVRNHSLPVVFLLSVRPWTIDVRTSSQGLIALKRTCDAVFTCEGFAAMVSPPPPEFSDLAGILTIKKIALQSLSHFSDTTTNRRPPANRYGMKRDRRKMHIRMLHLPPEDFSAGGSSVGSGARSGAGKVQEKDTSSITRVLRF
ncbi:hypothetical protein CTEN210_04212 [Chaetoceros tenuissimus]|uniref:Elongator complex protein 4 n=1 Tax=Chaetoceros tenuissimus TaxID=426638 RepID=A0AAD3CKI4_9STRA|nr:hypothetical protein CTEN210_04212 [Chaetoceros tenuissimus]